MCIFFHVVYIVNLRYEIKLENLKLYTCMRNEEAPNTLSDSSYITDSVFVIFTVRAIESNFSPLIQNSNALADIT